MRKVVCSTTAIGHSGHRIAIVATNLLIVVSAGLFAPSIVAQTTQGPFATPIASKYKFELLAKSVKDECVNPQQGLDTSLQVPYTTPTNGACPDGTVPKANQSRVWASAYARNGVWIGTAPNYAALGARDFPPYVFGTIPILPPTLESLNRQDFLGEWGNSAFYKEIGSSWGLAPASGDWRPPRVYRYDLVARKLVDKSPTTGVGLELINQTEGLRAGGTARNVVFLAGPSIIPTKPGVKMFAYDAVSGNLLAAKNFEDYSNVRQMLTIGNDLYIAMFSTGGDQANTGSIVRWVPTGTDLLTFETVGTLPAGVGAPSELTYSPVSGRIYVTTWSYTPGSQGAALLQSPTSHPPTVPFKASDALQKYTVLWTASQYSKDPAITAMVGGGAMAAYHEYVYWGTMTAPATGPLAYWSARFQINPTPPTMAEILEGNEKAQMPATVWRINVNGGQIELLYGASQVPVFDYYGLSGSRQWLMRPTGWTPKWGPAGFGNPYNYYIWTMKVFDDKLFVGASESAYLHADLGGPGMMMFGPAWTASGITQTQKELILQASPMDWLWGCDLVRFDNTKSPAVFENTTGLGNSRNIGVRTMVSDDRSLYMGTENSFNINAFGGWEMIRLYDEKR